MSSFPFPKPKFFHNTVSLRYRAEKHSPLFINNLCNEWFGINFLTVHPVSLSAWWEQYILVPMKLYPSCSGLFDSLRGKLRQSSHSTLMNMIFYVVLYNIAINWRELQNYISFVLKLEEKIEFTSMEFSHPL